MTIGEKIQSEKLAKIKRDERRGYFVLWFVVAFTFGFCLFAFSGGCVKSEAQKTRAAILSGCDTAGAGIYFPTIITSFNSNIVAINQAHFIKVCDQVFVSGTLGGSSSVDTLQSSYVKISLPISSDLSAPPLVNLYGQAMVQQFGVIQPLNAPVGALTVPTGSGAVISWHVVKKAAYSIAYSFSYTIK